MWPVNAPTFFELMAGTWLPTALRFSANHRVMHSSRIRVPGIRSPREVDVLYITEGERRIAVEVQHRNRKISQQDIDSFEGKRKHIEVAEIVLVSRAGYSQDARARVMASRGQLHAWTAAPSKDRLSTSGRAIVRVGNERDQITFDSWRATDEADGRPALSVFAGRSELLRVLAFVVIPDDAGAGGGAPLATILGHPQQPTAAFEDWELEVDGVSIDINHVRPTRTMEIPTGHNIGLI
jgi:Restriction endonuclease